MSTKNVPVERLELPTFGFEDRCSIQLSYTGKYAESIGVEPNSFRNELLSRQSYSPL